MITRMREWHAAGDRDVLQLSVDGSPPVDVITDFVKNGAIAIHVHDDAATPGRTTLAPLPFFGSRPFQSGVDVLLPASPNAAGRSRSRTFPAATARVPRR